MTQWELYIYYGARDYKLKADLEYHSNQVMRIRVHGSKSSILLENNYPLIKLAKSKKGIQWKIREGGFVKSTEKNSRLLMHIIEELERILKEEFPV